MTMRNISRQQFLLFKWSVYALLAINVFLYFMESKITESIDTLSWVVIIGLYEWETTTLDQMYANKLEMYAITFFRLLAYSILVYCAYDYYLDGKWLDFANSLTWFAVCATLEYDVYFPGNYDSSEWKVRNYTKLALYSLLFTYMVIWLAEGRALDFYDAFLWLLAFIVIELNIFGFEQRKLDKANKQPLHRQKKS